MTPTEKARRSDALYFDTKVTSRRALCDMVANLEADMEELRAFATDVWELLTCNEPTFVWNGLQEKARELRVEDG